MKKTDEELKEIIRTLYVLDSMEAGCNVRWTMATPLLEALFPFLKKVYLHAQENKE